MRTCEKGDESKRLIFRLQPSLFITISSQRFLSFRTSGKLVFAWGCLKWLIFSFPAAEIDLRARWTFGARWECLLEIHRYAIVRIAAHMLRCYCLGNVFLCGYDEIVLSNCYWAMFTHFSYDYICSIVFTDYIV